MGRLAAKGGARTSRDFEEIAIKDFHVIFLKTLHG